MKTMKEYIENAIRKGDVETLLKNLSQNKIHVRDIERIIQKIRKEDKKLLFNHKINVHEYERRINALNNVLKYINNEYHDFTINNKAVTLPRSEWLYKKY